MDKKPFIVGITGNSGSGKTSFLNQILTGHCVHKRMLDKKMYFFLKFKKHTGSNMN